jgi:hypothetical protein
MSLYATPAELTSAPVHGTYPTSAPRVPVVLRLELTQEEAVGVLATLSVNLHGHPHVTPVDGQRILHQLLADVVLQTAREAAQATQKDQAISPESASVNDWFHRLVSSTFPRQRAEFSPVGTTSRT